MIAGTKKKSARRATKIAITVNTPKLNMLLIVAVVNTKNPIDRTIEVTVIARPVPISVRRVAVSTSLYCNSKRLKLCIKCTVSSTASPNAIVPINIVNMSNGISKIAITIDNNNRGSTLGIMLIIPIFTLPTRTIIIIEITPNANK